MKKVLSAVLVLVLMLSLSTAVLAGDDLTDVVIEVTEDDYPTHEQSGQLEAAGDFALRTRYGFLWCNDDGSFVYRVDQELPTVKKALESKTALLDHFILTYHLTTANGWQGRHMNIVLLPEGADYPGEANYTVTDFSQDLQGTILVDGEVSNGMGLRCGLGRLELDRDGSYTYYTYNFMDCVQALLENHTREDRLPVAAVAADGSTEEFNLVVRTTGVYDAPPVNNINIHYNLTTGDLYGSWNGGNNFRIADIWDYNTPSEGGEQVIWQSDSMIMGELLALEPELGGSRFAAMVNVGALLLCRDNISESITMGFTLVSNTDGSQRSGVITVTLSYTYDESDDPGYEC